MLNNGQRGEENISDAKSSDALTSSVCTEWDRVLALQDYLYCLLCCFPICLFVPSYFFFLSAFFVLLLMCYYPQDSHPLVVSYETHGKKGIGTLFLSQAEDSSQNADNVFKL